MRSEQQKLEICQGNTMPRPACLLIDLKRKLSFSSFLYFNSFFVLPSPWGRGEEARGSGYRSMPMGERSFSTFGA